MDRKHRVSTCRTNNVKQTRRDAPDTRYAYTSIIKFIPSLFSYRIKDCMHFLLKLILNRRSCDSWIRLSQRSTVIDLSPSFNL